MRIVLRVLFGSITIGMLLLHWILNPAVPVAQPRDVMAANVSVEPLPLTVHCAGALAEIGGESGVELGKVERVGEALISASFKAESLIELPPVVSIEGFSAVATDGDQSTNLISVLQSQVVDRERASGLAASYCPKPKSTGWLINGSAVVGSESVLIAANPGPVEALVELEFHLNARLVSEQIALAPGETRLIPTAAYANGEENFAVFFQSSGPAISMAMQNRETRGLQPIGVEIEPTTLAPDKSFVFAGFRPLTQGFEIPVMRIYNPGSDASDVVITSFGEQNIELFRQQIPPKSFAEVELIVEEGYQLISLESSSAVLAAIRNPAIDPVVDFAWIQPAELFSSVTMPLSPYRNNLVIANPRASAIEVLLEVRFGSRTSVETAVVSPFSQLVLPLAASSVKLSGSGLFAVALEILDPSGYAVVSPTESSNLGRDLKIFVN